MSSKFKHALNFENTVMIGRQNMHIGHQQLQDCLTKFDYKDADVTKIMSKQETDTNIYAEGLFKTLGASKVDAVDASTYENASIIHDMNEPIPDRHKEGYDVVVDSGTLEHVFNFPQAIKNCMEITAVGGHFIGIYPCNNFFGHGFYQFSSETFYRVLSDDNGFEVKDVIIFVDEPNGAFYSIPDTSEEHHRITFKNSKPVLLYVIAKRLEKKPILVKNPQQMDYAAMKWKGNKPVKKTVKKRATLKSKTPQYFKNIIKAVLNKKTHDDRSYFNRSYFKSYTLK
ncbi:hypothetical protein [Dokdonia sp.]